MSEPSDRDREVSADLWIGEIPEPQILATYREEIEARVRAEAQEAIDLVQHSVAESEDRLAEAQAEIKNSQNEAAQVRRSYLHEKAEREKAEAEIERLKVLNSGLTKDFNTMLLAESRAKREALEAAIPVIERAIIDGVEAEAKAISKGSAPYSEAFRWAILCERVNTAIRALMEPKS